MFCLSFENLYSGEGEKKDFQTGRFQSDEQAFAM